jgi:IS605 OrfB family transposase
MKLTAPVKLLTTPEQAELLKQSLRLANTACGHIAQRAFEHGVFGRFALQKLVYYDVRATVPLAAQVVVRCIAKVADAYTVSRRRVAAFKPLGALAYDRRILSWKLDAQTVSIWTVGGRQTIPFACGPRQRELLRGRRGEADLCYLRGTFYLFVACDVATPEPRAVQAVLGVDLGLVNLATDSDGERHTGEGVERKRRTYAHRRRNLQRKGTHSAKRKLRHLAGKQARFQRNENHRISKRLVHKAQDTARAIALEDLGGIRERVTVRKPQRARHANWSYAQLRQYITYKAERAGVPVVLVDPRGTSRSCPRCGHCDAANRRTQERFSCVVCGYAGLADHVAAQNIRARAVVNPPMVPRPSWLHRSGGAGTSSPL